MIGLFSALLILLGGAAFWLGSQPAKPARPGRSRSRTTLVVDAVTGRTLTAAGRRTHLIKAALAAVLGIAATVVTGWLGCLVVVPAAVFGLPFLLSSGASTADPERLDALETWTRSLSSRMAAGHGLRQNLIMSVGSCPDPIRREVSDLAARLNAGMPTGVALRQFADDLNDATGDKLVLPLILAADAQAAGLRDRLDNLASSTADAVRNRRRLEADRGGPRTSVRIVTVVFIGLLAWTLLTGGERVDPYREPGGQIILAIFIAAFIGLLLLLRRMTTVKPLPRFIPKDR